MAFQAPNAGSAIAGQAEARTRNARFYGPEHPKITGVKQDTRFQAPDSILLYRQPVATRGLALSSESIDRAGDWIRSQN
jgi:hypothetical protein